MMDEGSLCSPGAGGGRGNDGGTCVRVFGKTCPSAPLNESTCDWEFGKMGRKRERDAGYPPAISAVVLAAVSTWEVKKISCSMCAQRSPWLLTGSHLPFRPVPSAFPFLFSCSMKLFSCCTLLCRSCFIPACMVFKTAFSAHLQSWFCICASSLDLPDLKRKRQSEPATTWFSCHYSSLSFHLSSPLKLFNYYYCCYYYYSTRNKLPNEILLLFAILNTIGEAGGKRRGIHSILLLMQNETHTRNKFCLSRKWMRDFLSEPKKMVRKNIQNIL